MNARERVNIVAEITVLKRAYIGDWVMENVFNYCDNHYWLLGEAGLDSSNSMTVFQDMQRTKMYYEKTGGKQICRMIITIDNEYGLDKKNFLGQLFDTESYFRTMAKYISQRVANSGY